MRDTGVQPHRSHRGQLRRGRGRSWNELRGSKRIGEPSRWSGRGERGGRGHAGSATERVGVGDGAGGRRVSRSLASIGGRLARAAGSALLGLPLLLLVIIYPVCLYMFALQHVRMASTALLPFKRWRGCRFRGQTEYTMVLWMQGMACTTTPTSPAASPAPISSAHKTRRRLRRPHRRPRRRPGINPASNPATDTAADQPADPARGPRRRPTPGPRPRRRPPRRRPRWNQPPLRSPSALRVTSQTPLPATAPPHAVEGARY